MLGTIKSKKGKLWMLLREGKSQQNAPLAEALKGGLEPWWPLRPGPPHRPLERETTVCGTLMMCLGTN